MALMLVQHGTAVSADVDPERGLSAEGKADVEKIADTARGYRVRITGIMHSGKKRARQTAEIFAERLGPGVSVTAVDGMNPGDNAALFADRLDASGDQMLVGHLPFMEKLASYLVTGSTERPVFRFQNGGIVCLDIHPGTGTWVITWTLMPEIG